MLDKLNIRRLDIIIFFCLISLSILSVTLIYSSDTNANGILIKYEHLKQTLWIFLGFLSLFLLMKYDLKIIDSLIYPFYFLFLIILTLTLKFGITVNGAVSWIGLFGLGGQPSEFGKILIILLLSKFYSSNSNKNSIVVFFQALLILSPSIILILLQPDLGTVIVYMGIFITISFFANVNILFLLFFIMFGILSFVLGILPVWYEYKNDLSDIIYLALSHKSYFLALIISLVVILLLLIFGYLNSKNNLRFKNLYFLGIFIFLMFLSALIFSKFVSKMIKPYQAKRFLVFLDPNIDFKGSGWNLRQVKIAIGSGGIFGKGFLKGPYTHTSYVPSQSTDFIFSILAEEFGLLGGFFVLFIFALLFYRILKIAQTTLEYNKALIVFGVFALLSFHTLFNIGMSLGVLPITGIPLPFLSYGGSSILTFFLSIALVLNIYNYRTF